MIPTANWLFDHAIETLAGFNVWQRTLAFFVLWIFVWLPVIIPLARALTWQPHQPLQPSQKIAFVASLYLVAWPILWVAAQLPAYSWHDYGLASGYILGVGGAAGLGLALLGLAVVFATESWLGWLTWRPQNLPRLVPLALPILAIALWVSCTEEVIFRGVLLSWFAAEYGGWLALLITSAAFALAHLVWGWRQALPQLPGLFFMAVVLVLARQVAAGNLGLACGLHAGWIWGLTALDTAALMQYSDRASPWLTGLDGQPLAGLAGGLCLLLTAAALVLWSGGLALAWG